MNTVADTRIPFRQALAALADQLRAAGNLDAIMLDAGGAVAGLFSCDRFTLYAVDAEGDYLVSKVKALPHGSRDVKVAIASHAIAGHAALARRAVNIADAYDDAELARVAPGLRFPRGVDERTGYRTKQVLAVPVLAPGSQALLGVIQLVNTRDGEPFGAQAVEGAVLLGESLAGLLAAPPDRRQTLQVPAAVREPSATRALVAVPAPDEPARLLARIVADACRLGASAIHIEAAPSAASAIRLRRDGALARYAGLPAPHAAALASHIATIANLADAEPGKPWQGTIDGRAQGLPDVQLHVIAIASVAGTDWVLRVAAENAPLPLAQLGLAPDHLASLRRMLDGEHGLLLVCGPRETGKSTTLHALLGCLDGVGRKICTAEASPAPVQPGVRQVRVDGSPLDLAGALEAFRHADADVIVADAPGGPAAAGLAVEAALTGRLVLAALPARGAAEGAMRLLDLCADPFGAAAALAGVLAQRLARRLCTACRLPYHPGMAELDLLLTEYCEELQPAGADAVADAVADTARAGVLSAWRGRHADAAGRFTLYRAVGCAACQGGYRGRVGLFELMVVGERTARLLAQRPAAARLAGAAIDEGMRTLKMDGIDKVLAGMTDIRMVRAACAR
ncbi:GspE/PulE family protein [Pseudoduganella lutea]|uniref:GAF domain-containing protein n=1 Tax=Pseudoduganella lutea TaxID=321985 RepID=A0A4P6L0K8_9BURK|nr:ATPase, T2SS/T4P/T4SS family [Pseudoduganella lutea]QBE65021.1 GAF domain-containing protein [Pseudoduganella lutea]